MNRFLLIKLCIAAILSLLVPTANAQVESSSGNTGANPEEPVYVIVRTDTPQETMASFRDWMTRGKQAYMDYTRKQDFASFQRLQRLFRMGYQLIDMSTVPESSRDEVGSDTLFSLLDIFNRVELPDAESIPKVEEFEGADARSSWRIPGTPLRIGLVTSGPREGQFLFISRTNTVAPMFRQQIQQLPLLDNATVKNWHWQVANLSGPAIPAGFRDILPQYLRRDWLGTPIWKVALVVLLMGVTGIVLFYFNRIVSRRRRDSTGSSAWQMLTPLVLVAVVALLESFIFDQILIGGSFSVAVEYTANVAYTIAWIWLFWLVARLATELAIQSPRIEEESLDASFVRLLGQVIGLAGGVLIAALGLNRMGVPAFSVLAGLGIGGVAVAIAVQPLLTSLIAGFTLFAEKAIRVGDFVRVGNWEGHIKAIGVRSTQIELNNRTVVTVPNSRMVGMDINNWGYSNCWPLITTFSLLNIAPADQLRWVLTKIREMLHSHPRIENESVRVRMVAFGESGYDIEVRVFVLTREKNAFFAIREDVLLRIRDIIAESGSEFGAATQLVLLERFSGLDEDSSQRATEETSRLRQARQMPFPEFTPEQREQMQGSLDYPPVGSPDQDGRETPGATNYLSARATKAKDQPQS